MAEFSSDDISQFISKYPGFNTSEENGQLVLSGNASIDADGRSYTFQIKVCPNNKFPYRFPSVFEISDKIKKIADWHINSDGSFCFTVEPIEAIACKKGITLSDFYSKWLVPYLSNQQYRINEGKYANGEYSHNFIGIFEYYSGLLKTDNIFNIGKGLAIAIDKKKIERTSVCYCGSRIKYRHCHKKATEQLWESGDEVLKNHLLLFKSIILKLQTNN